MFRRLTKSVRFVRRVVVVGGLRARAGQLARRLTARPNRALKRVGASPMDGLGKKRHRPNPFVVTAAPPDPETALA